MSILAIAASLVAAAALAVVVALVVARGRDARRAAALAAEKDRLGREAVERQAALERAVVALEGELVDVHREVRRVADSRSWRYAHALSKLASTLVGRPPAAADSAIDVLVERLERLELPSDGTYLLARSGARPRSKGGRARRAPGPRRAASSAGTPEAEEAKVMVVALGFAESRLAEMLAGLAEAPEAVRESVLLVTDRDAFELLRQAGSAFEFFPPRGDWERHFPDRPYEDFVNARLEELQAGYTPRRTVVLGEAADAVLSGLAARIAP